MHRQVIHGRAGPLLHRMSAVDRSRCSTAEPAGSCSKIWSGRHDASGRKAAATKGAQSRCQSARASGQWRCRSATRTAMAFPASRSSLVIRRGHRRARWASDTIGRAADCRIACRARIAALDCRAPDSLRAALCAEIGQYKHCAAAWRARPVLGTACTRRTRRLCAPSAHGLTAARYAWLAVLSRTTPARYGTSAARASPRPIRPDANSGSPCAGCVRDAASGWWRGHRYWPGR